MLSQLLRLYVHFTISLFLFMQSKRSVLWLGQKSVQIASNCCLNFHWKYIDKPLERALIYLRLFTNIFRDIIDSWEQLTKMLILFFFHLNRVGKRHDILDMISFFTVGFTSITKDRLRTDKHTSSFHGSLTLYNGL